MSKLEAATAEATAHIPLEKAPLLEEIYRVAKLEERFLAGGLGTFHLSLIFDHTVPMLTKLQHLELCATLQLQKRSSKVQIKRRLLLK